MSPKVSIVIEKDDYGYYTYCPELEGCQSQGDTLEEVMANIKEAIDLVKETCVGECACNPRCGGRGRLRN